MLFSHQTLSVCFHWEGDFNQSTYMIPLGFRALILSGDYIPQTYTHIGNLIPHGYTLSTIGHKCVGYEKHAHSGDREMKTNP